MGEAPTSAEANPDAGFEEFRDALAHSGHAGECAKPCGRSPGRPKGQPLRAGETLPCSEEGRLTGRIGNIRAQLQSPQALSRSPKVKTHVGTLGGATPGWRDGRRHEEIYPRYPRSSSSAGHRLEYLG